jgi:DNA-binding CsgD family transcriptional regulator
MLDVLGLGARAESVYRSMLRNPKWGIVEIAGDLGIAESAVKSALDELFEFSLIRRSAERDGELRAVNPAVGLQSLLARQQSDVEHRMQRVAAGRAAVDALLAEYTQPADDRPPFEAVPVVGIDAIQDRLEELSGRTTGELLSIVPTVHSTATVEVARANNAELFARNVTVRTTMQDAARNSPVAASYAKSLTEAGADVRTAPLLPPRMLIFDRAVAVVPIDPARSADGMLQLTARGVVDALTSLFEQVWATAVPFGASLVRDRQGVTPSERELLKLLAQAHTDRSAAKRLGVSERTCRRMMADLMERLGARSRFEAGLLAAREGWL